jgi:hypothetical protein
MLRIGRMLRIFFFAVRGWLSFTRDGGVAEPIVRLPRRTVPSMRIPKFNALSEASEESG